jgi:hypothetical protein
VATVTVQQRAGAEPRYLGGAFTHKERYPAATDTAPLLLTPAAADAVPDLQCVPLPERGGLLRLASPDAARAESTWSLLGHELLIGRGVVPVASFRGRPVPQDPGTSRLSRSFWS